MRVRDGPAAVRGDAPPPRSHWPNAGKAAEEGAPSQKTCRAPHNRTPRGRRIQVLRSSTLVAVTVRGGTRGARLERARAAARHRRQFPVTIATPAGKVTVAKKPRRIVSLSPTATESLFAIGAGSQVRRRRRSVRLSEDGAEDEALGLHAERRGDRGVPPGPRRHRVRPEAASRPRCGGSGSSSSTTTGRVRSPRRTSRSASSGSSPATRPRRHGSSRR